MTGLLVQDATSRESCLHEVARAAEIVTDHGLSVQPPPASAPIHKRLTACLLLAGTAHLASAQSRPYWIANANDILFRHYLGVELWQWIGLVAVGAISVALGLLARLVVGALISIRDRISDAPISKAVRRSLKRSMAILVFSWVATLLVDELYLHARAASASAKILTAFQIIGYVLLGCAIWESMSERLAARVAGHSARAERLLIPLTSKLVRAAIVVVGIFFAIAELTNVNISALVASLGIGGLVVALAAKDSIENVFGSITILFDMPFALGDWVRIDKVEGVVEEINLRSTRIRTFEDTVINLPNSNLIRAAVENFGARRVRRQRLHLKLNPDNSAADLDRLAKAIRKYLHDAKEVQHDRVIVALDSLDDASISLLVQCYFEADTQKEEMRLKEALLLKVMELRDECGVQLATETREARQARLKGAPLK